MTLRIRFPDVALLECLRWSMCDVSLEGLKGVKFVTIIFILYIIEHFSISVSWWHGSRKWRWTTCIQKSSTEQLYVGYMSVSCKNCKLIFWVINCWCVRNQHYENIGKNKIFFSHALTDELTCEENFAFLKFHWMTPYMWRSIQEIPCCWLGS